jgi:hypothetical protein
LQSLYEFVAHCKMTKKRDDRGNAGMPDGNADVNGESEVGSDVDAATDGTVSYLRRVIDSLVFLGRLHG